MADFDSASSASVPKLHLKDFLECFPPPQSGRIVEGLQPDFDAHEAFDLPRGSVLNFHRQVSPNVPLSFRDPWGGINSDKTVKVTLPLEFQGKFRILPFDPETGDMSPDHVYETVEDLVKVFPVYAQANTAIRGDLDEGLDVMDTPIQCGDRLKLIRLVHKYGQKLLECRLLGEARLCLLPMDCVGSFTVLPDYNDYLLSDLMSMLPRKRRLQASESTSKQHKIPGVPAHFTGDLYLEEPESFVEASPMEDPSLIIGLPNNLNVTVSPEDNCYDRGMLLSTFATNNRNLFPVVARVTDWDEETTILENHYVKPGIDLVVHGWTRQSKVLAEAQGKYYAVPLAYQGQFRILTHKFHGASELERSHPAYPVRVSEGDPAVPLARGDILRIRREDSIRSHSKHAEIQYIRCEKLEANGRYKDLKLPMSCLATFEEVVEGERESELYQIKELVPFVTESEVLVELITPSTDQKIKERDIPTGVPITLCDFVIEPAVYVSVETTEAPAFHIPLRTLLYVTYVQQLEKQTSPLLTRQNTRLSTLDRCIEIVPRDVFSALQPRSDDSSGSLATGQQQTNAWVRSNGGNATEGGSEAYEFGTLRAVPARQQSFASDIGTGKPKGFKAKLKHKFRKHKSQENLHKVSNSVELIEAAGREEHSQMAVPSTSRGVDHGNRVIHHQMIMKSVSAQPSPSASARPSPPQSTISAATVNGPVLQTRGVVKANPLFQASQPSPPPHQKQGTLNQAPTGSVHMAHSHIGQTQLIQGTNNNNYMNVPLMQTSGGNPSYVMVPAISPPNNSPQTPPGYMLVPMITPQMMAQMTLAKGHDDSDDDSVEYSDVAFRQKKQFKVSIPPDGNLYNFSARKMQEFFRQLRISEETARRCAKEKIDGKKFARMSEAELDSIGLMHPIVVHFRKLTHNRPLGRQDFQL